MDLIYAPDCGRAIAAVHTAGHLAHPIDNVGGGAAVTNREFAAALGVDVPLRPGRSARAVPGDPFLDVTRLHADTAYRPAFDPPGAVADHVGRLRAGHPL
ncbi:hypothetical protein [Cryptosporangium sp. NPDC051539]|uniref:hypothetical protein n=1 Tax=Cryptosporangium sp. NPDC051539 TaxID=3363962 RepID=UPI003787F981